VLDYYNKYNEMDELLWSVRVLKLAFQTLGINLEDSSYLEFANGGYVYPPEYFYPLPYSKADTFAREKYITAKSYTIHYWNASWKDEWSLLWAGRYAAGFKRILKEIAKNPRRGKEYYKSITYHVLRLLRK
jgi:hypothetical protein